MAASQCYMWYLSDSECFFKGVIFTIETQLKDHKEKSMVLHLIGPQELFQRLKIIQHGSFESSVSIM